MVEEHGIATIGVSIVRKFSEEVRPPRTVFVKWPYGHPLGEPGHVNQHRAVLENAFDLLETASEPGIIRDLPYKWKRETYG